MGEIKETGKLTYLGGVVNKDGGTDEDVKNRINKAKYSFKKLRPIWNSEPLSIKYVKAVAVSALIRILNNF